MGFQLIVWLGKSWCWQDEGGRNKDEGMGLGEPHSDSSCLALLVAIVAVTIVGVCWSIKSNGAVGLLKGPSPIWPRWDVSGNLTDQKSSPVHGREGGSAGLAGQNGSWWGQADDGAVGCCWWRIQPVPWDHSSHRLGTAAAPNHTLGPSCFAVWPHAWIVKVR